MPLSGRSLLFIIPAMIISISLIDTMQVSAEDPIAYGPHWIPVEPKTGEEFDLFIYVSGLNSSNLDSVHLVLNDDDHSLIDLFQKSDQFDNGTVYHCTLTLSKKGIFTYNVTVEINGTVVNIYNGEIEVFESGPDKGEDTILGLPRWWCVISVIFGTIFMIFLTWAYFKGRSLKRGEMDNIHTGMTCSSCGGPIGKDDTKCSKCGSILDDFEYICGKCGKNVTHRSINCKHCGSRLKKPGHESREENDHDLKKLHGTIDLKGKVNCPYCNGIISSSDRRCPACKKKF